MKKIFVALAILLSLGATSVAQADDGGAIIGAVVGGFTGNQVGQGNGKIAATIVGAGLGAVIGDRVSSPSVVYSSQEEEGGYTQQQSTYRDRPLYRGQQAGWDACYRQYGNDEDLERECRVSASNRAAANRSEERAIARTYGGGGNYGSGGNH